MNKKYDEVVKLPCDKLAQTMSDLTYCYQETKVPKAHYKKILEETIEEDLDEIMTSKMLDLYLKTLKQIIDDSPRLFLKSLLCLDKKINPLNMRPNELQALDEVVEEYEKNKKKFKGYLNEELLDLFETVEKNGLIADEESDKIAIKVGCSFTLVNVEKLKEIELKETGMSVKYNHKVYKLYCGRTYEDSRKIDELLDYDEDVDEKKVSEYQA